MVNLMIVEALQNLVANGVFIEVARAKLAFSSNQLTNQPLLIVSDAL